MTRDEQPWSEGVVELAFKFEATLAPRALEVNCLGVRVESNELRAEAEHAPRAPILVAAPSGRRPERRPQTQHKTLQQDRSKHTYDGKAEGTGDETIGDHLVYLHLCMRSLRA